ncbi:MAG TPA: hypothetical protein VKX96_09400, partial [Chloroflexota bacterium]|nr:hypothetical protein [Chloroflexota bacterium]
LSSAMAEVFLQTVDDNVFVSNMVFQTAWDEAEQVEEGRTFNRDIRTGKSKAAASFPWAFYVVSVAMDYQTLKVNRGWNARVKLVAVQIQAGIASLADLCGTDLTNVTKGAATTNGVNALGVVEATDDGTLVNRYGNILRTGAGSFPNWSGNVNRSLLVSGIGSPSNDMPFSKVYDVFTRCTQGAETPTEVFTTQQGVAAYMFAQQAQQRVIPMSMADAGFLGADVFGASMLADQHFTPPMNGTSVGCNYYFINRRHTRFRYMGEKGFEFFPWVDLPNRVAKVARYVTCFQYASSQPGTGGQLLNVNAVTCSA